MVSPLKNYFLVTSLESYFGVIGKPPFDISSDFLDDH